MRTTTAEARRQCLSLRRFIPSGLGSAGRWRASIAFAEAGPASQNALSEHCEREGYLGLSRLMEVPRPLLALPVQRPGMPGHPAAKFSSVTGSPLLVGLAITVRASDGVRDPIKDDVRSHIEQDEMTSQEAILDVVGECRQNS